MGVDRRGPARRVAVTRDCLQKHALACRGRADRIRAMFAMLVRPPTTRRAIVQAAVLAGLLAGVSSSAPVSAVSSAVLISEFRVRGPNGAADEFVELYNASNTS